MGDSLHLVLCAAGFNIRWLLRMIIKKGGGLFFAVAAGSGFDRFAAQIASDLHLQPGQLRLDELGDGLKVNFSGTTNWRKNLVLKERSQCPQNKTPLQRKTIYGFRKS
jgi:hypothetical protein